MKLDRKTLLTTKSDRVKCLDFHPTEPWLISGLYNGQANLHNYDLGNLLKTFQVSDLPIRAVKFISRKNLVVFGCDDFQIKLFNYNTMEKVGSFDAHSDYIRSIIVHPTRNLIVTSSDDMTIKSWDLDTCKLLNNFEGHFHYVMGLSFNPKDFNVFASCSLDKSIKIWQLDKSQPNFSLEGHEKGVNSIEYLNNADKSLLVSASDDFTIKIWDYQTKSCLQTLSSHTQNVSSACFHPELPLIISVSEDSTCKVWNSFNFKLEATLSYGFERIWALAVKPNSNQVALGCDQGTVAFQIGREEPAVSMDQSGKIVLAKKTEILSTSVKNLVEEQDHVKLNLNFKDLGNCDFYPSSIQHSPNGKFVAVVGDGEYIIYSSLAWRSKDFGKGLDFCWGHESTEFAVRESPSKIQVYNNFKQIGIIEPLASSDGLFGGQLIGIRCVNFICFYDWETLNLVRKIDVVALNVFWGLEGNLAITTKEKIFILKLNKERLFEPSSEDGIEDSFEFIDQVNEQAISCLWIGSSLLFSTRTKLSLFIGSKVTNLNSTDSCFILGFLNDKIFLTNKDLEISSFSVSLKVIDYQQAITRNDLILAESLIESIPNFEFNNLAKFLYSQNYKQKALELTSDKNFKFEIALELNLLDLAAELAVNQTQFKLIAQTALSNNNYFVYEKFLLKSNDLASLMLFYSAKQDFFNLNRLGELALEKQQFNMAFSCFYLCGQVEKAIDLLANSGKIAEATLMARSFLPNKVEDLVDKWKQLKSSKISHLLQPNLELDPIIQLNFSTNNKDSPLVQEMKNLKVTFTELKDDQLSETNTENVSYLSTEVNTTGTGSVKGLEEVEVQVFESQHEPEPEPEDDVFNEFDQELAENEFEHEDLFLDQQDVKINEEDLV